MVRYRQERRRFIRTIRALADPGRNIRSAVEGNDVSMMPSDLLGFTEFEQYEDDKTDMVIYSFNKLVLLFPL